jgi:nitrate reductase gamma subunit
MIALCLSLWVPEWAMTQAMVDKNNPATAFLFDITGAMVLLGAAAAWIRGLRKKPEQPADLPGQDHLDLGLMTGIILFGFILEGMRIAMTGRPDGSWNAFIGYTISGIFSDTADLTGIYGYVWYAHAVLTGAFVAYLPFSRMFHIIMAPIVLVMNAVSDHEGHERSE